MTSQRRYVIKISILDYAKVLTLVQSIIHPNFVAISQLVRELWSLQDYDVMTSQRRYVIEIANFGLTKSFALVQSIIPPIFVAISQLLGDLEFSL